MIAPDDVLGFWFGGVDNDAAGLERTFKRWFMGGRQLDVEIEARFGTAVESALAGGFAEWEREPRERLALVLLLDQFPRNMFRRTAGAFAGDQRALRLAESTVASGELESLQPLERFFLLMPYQHAEDIEVQERGVALFEALTQAPVSEDVAKLLRSGLDYARRHRDIVARFGRFPYRNEALGRETTSAEAEWMENSGERFGQ